ncbi:MAG: hypothetical protein JWR35_694 [Marmoricola sp.]|jgi:hypothetical protein|nr:hypothetical protein [Marmoricola sp.]
MTDNEAPDPKVDTDPEATENPGGIDAVVDDPDDLPPQTPDQPQSAQIQDHEIPDEIQEPEAPDDNPDESEVSEPSA